jgi:hypothetical protein
MKYPKPFINSLVFAQSSKPATIVAVCSEFTVKKAEDGKIVYSGKVSGPYFQQEFNQMSGWPT